MIRNQVSLVVFFKLLEESVGEDPILLGSVFTRSQEIRTREYET